MLTRCPSCQVRVRLSGEHEGNRVRCSECGRVYVARPSGRMRARPGLWIGAVLGAIALVLWILLSREANGSVPVGRALVPLFTDLVAAGRAPERASPASGAAPAADLTAVMRVERASDGPSTPIDLTPIDLTEEEQRRLERHPDE